MELKILNPQKTLNKAFLKVKPNRSEIEKFKAFLIQLLDRTNDAESEEFHKNLVSDFLKKTYYDTNHFINTKGRNDLVIHNGKVAKSSVGVIIEAKKPTNRSEMLKQDNINAKAFHELILYYLRERITGKNLEIKYLIATNINEWFIFDANLFEKAFAQDKSLVKQFNDFEAGRLTGKTTDFFYKEIAEPAIAKLDHDIEFTYFDIRDYEKPLKSHEKKNENKLISLYKVLSPEHLLKQSFINDSNTLDKKFYAELLHIIGLTEIKEGSKKLIGRKKDEERNSGSLLENAIIQLDSLDKINRLDKPDHFGNTYQERLFNVALELSITWINRVLFLKLLEAQLISYNKDKTTFSFLNPGVLPEFDDLNSLFFQVLAKPYNERNDDIEKNFGHIPYLNSSLFEPTEIEHACLFISQLEDNKTIPIYQQTVLKDDTAKKRTGEIRTLQYLFEFLDAYDFSSEGTEEIQEDNKTLINASVLGLIFEKINGYKDGSFFTPGFITMYMCRETIRRAVVQKFNEAKKWDCKDLDELYDKIDDRQEANDIVNSLKICDPAVGSGHFLVSALNEIIAVKNDLRILQDREGKRMKEYHLEVVNDELIVADEDGDLFEYKLHSKESQRVQEALFHEKQTIIEHSLFGVDINPNSVKICRLRLWIELLKNTYYKSDPHSQAGDFRELETLPNIDINIKCGNSLISRFALDADLKDALKKSKWTIDTYRIAVDTYRNAQNRERKHEMERLIKDIKRNFRTEISRNSKEQKRIDKLGYELFQLTGKGKDGIGLMLFEPKSFYGKEKELEKKRTEKIKKIEDEINKLSLKIDEVKSNKIYENAFEWRFEFPEVLDDNGEFIGFDLVIGNPPYFSLSKIKDIADAFHRIGYQTYSRSADIYCLFYEKGNQLLKSDGLLTFITSNSWLRAIYGELLKKYFVENMQPIGLLNIEDIQVFEEATVESNIITLQKKHTSTPFAVCNLGKDYKIGSSLSDYFYQHQFLFTIPATPEWIISNLEEGQLKLKIEKDSAFLKQFEIEINFGIKTGYNAAFIIDGTKRNELILDDPKNEEIIKPILRGRNLYRYGFKFKDVYIINVHNGLKHNNQPRINVEKNYPIIHNHLISFLPKVKERYDKGDHWTNLRNCTYLEDFEKPKIVWGEISDKPKFAYDDSNYYAEATTFLMTGEKLKYLLGILNSRVSEWYFNQIGTTTGMGTNRWKKYKIEMFPIKLPSKEKEIKIENLVNKILTLKKQNPSADTTTLEKEIDQLVYRLYGLTEEEIEIVEGENG